MNTHDIELPPLVGTLAGLPDRHREVIEAYGRACARSAIEPYQQRIEELESQLEAVGAGGVSPIMGCQRCRQLQGVLQAVLDDKVTVLSRGVYDQIREALA